MRKALKKKKKKKGWGGVGGGKMGKVRPRPIDPELD